MVKILGAAMVMVGAVGLAWRGVERLKERAETLRSLQGAFSYLEEELAFRFTPLPALFAHLGETRGGAVGEFFAGVWREMERPQALPLRQSWAAASRRALPMLREEERQVVDELGEVLGQYDAQTQARALRLAGERMAGLYLSAQEERQRLGKVYLALGAAGGLATVLALI